MLLVAKNSAGRGREEHGSGIRNKLQAPSIKLDNGAGTM